MHMGQHMKCWFLCHDINQFKWPFELIYIMILEPTLHVLAHIHIARVAQPLSNQAF